MGETNTIERSVATLENVDPVDAYITAATLPPREIRLKELDPLRREAIEALEKRYGNFDPDMAQQVVHPVHRFMIMGELASVGWGKSRRMDRLRMRRTQAIQVLHFTYGWKPMKIVRAIKAEERRIVDSAINTSDDTQRPDWTEEHAESVAKKMHKACEKAKEYATEVLPYRDRLIHDLAEGRWVQDADGRWYRLSDEELEARLATTDQRVGISFSNAELGRLGHLSSAAVAQIRNETHPAARRAAAAA